MNKKKLQLYYHIKCCSVVDTSCSEDFRYVPPVTPIFSFELLGRSTWINSDTDNDTICFILNYFLFVKIIVFELLFSVWHHHCLDQVLLHSA